MIVERIKDAISFGTVIPKPEAKADFLVKGWGKRRGEPALIYLIPNHSDASKPHQKGITESEFEKAFSELLLSGVFTRHWFNQHLSNCAREGACNFTTIGGIFVFLGEAEYSGRGVYRRRVERFALAATLTDPTPH